MMAGPTFSNLPEPFSELDWHPQQVNALFPILADDCDDYAFVERIIGRGPVPTVKSMVWYIWWAGFPSWKAEEPAGCKRRAASIAIARECGFAVLRTVGHDKVPGQLAVIGIGSERAFNGQAYDIPKDFDQGCTAASPDPKRPWCHNL